MGRPLHNTECHTHDLLDSSPQPGMAASGLPHHIEGKAGWGWTHSCSREQGRPAVGGRAPSPSRPCSSWCCAEAGVCLTVPPAHPCLEKALALLGHQALWSASSPPPPTPAGAAAGNVAGSVTVRTPPPTGWFSQPRGRTVTPTLLPSHSGSSWLLLAPAGPHSRLQLAENANQMLGLSPWGGGRKQLLWEAQ
jgi:hypothetical protein